MKNAMKIFALALCLVMMVSVFAACGDITGEYEYSQSIAGYEMTMTLDFATFSNSVTVTTSVTGEEDEVEEYTYEISDDGKKVTLTDANGDTETLSFEEGDGYIIVGGMKFTEK